MLTKNSLFEIAVAKLYCITTRDIVTSSEMSGKEPFTFCRKKNLPPFQAGGFCISNRMISSAIWTKHARAERVQFSTASYLSFSP